MLTVLIGMVAIAIDGSRAYAVRRDLQAATDGAALAAADKMQQTGSYVTAEQAATSNFGTNLRLYAAPSCSPNSSTTIPMNPAAPDVVAWAAQAMRPFQYGCSRSS